MGTNPLLQELAAVVVAAADSEPPRPRPRVVRILVHDADATDSSSSEDEARPPPRRRARGGNSSVGVRRHVMEPAGASSSVRFRGVRRRPWGRWAAEIRDPHSRRRLWLGTFNTAEEAANAYDAANIRFRGASAPTNFPAASYSPPPEPAKPIISLTPEPGKVITLPPVPVKQTFPLQVKEEGGSRDGQVKGGSSEVKALPPKRVWEMIPSKRQKYPGCADGSGLRAIHAASLYVEEVGGA
ncbi:hypothetical protein BDA96_01G041400 [Sorghum bicolor]|uniref:AP2/ERF domain-containing protein n=2 Tax=Sorghum bicolor TaxID=4558 RepID=C5WV63_SORBI|nr:ethylene-responsive transcription factor CRF4 [Sorghum bicolor]EER90653.1 hypothetical protein SORBI_3001G039800 [Sorghum bicolor]KAG0547000.1 hypothetical protein BDA96_01G041400 [Sorghum bicolor]|eukprot:XP_002463655.1 ethylene-responsive transcription factor CRF4 [Sorghum bicolor]